MPRISARLSDTALRQIEALADQRGCTLSAIIRAALDRVALHQEHADAPLREDTEHSAHTAEECAQHFLQYLDQDFPGSKSFVLESAHARRRSVAETLAW